MISRKLDVTEKGREAERTNEYCTNSSICLARLAKMVDVFHTVVAKSPASITIGAKPLL
jgi:hypothetical protein